MSEKQKEINLVFLEVVEKPTVEERAAYLDEVCRNDSTLRAELESLLRAHEKAGGFLNPPFLDAEAALDLPLTEQPGTVIGRYKLLEQIGEGGMAVVHMAEQTEPIRRKVALKIIKLGMDTKSVIARFEAERQALAMMDHPNIAKVLDAGATETGRPYFVMELVEGASITEFCDANNLSTQKRLELFVCVCQAVQHAHQKGIIHRDIKPTNVMVTLQDGKPVPKVIDFGIAKATNQKLTERTLFTRYSQMIGTPAYMSPEQAEMSEPDIDTRSDIYSLGVLLYELLTGTTPFDAQELRQAGYAELQRIIQDQEPTKPSTKLETLGETLTEVAVHHKTTPDLLKKRIRGDLDWIVMKSLEKDRNRRYETASELVMDIERHLSDEPVRAGPPGAGYRLRKFVRRNRIAVMTGLLVPAGLLIVAIFSALYAIETEKARQETSVLLAGSYIDKAQTLCEQGEVGGGMLWLAESLKIIPPGSDDLDRAIRTSLAAWHAQLHSLRVAVQNAPFIPSLKERPVPIFMEEPVGTYTITGSGADIYGTTDQFHFAYKILTGQGSITARIESIEPTHRWARTGVMIRETLDAGSKHVLTCATPDNCVRFQHRADPGAFCTDTNQSGIAAPRWVKLERDAAGNFTASHSADGITWEPVADSLPANIPMDPNVYVGLAVTSNDPLVMCEAVFSNVTTTGSVSAGWVHKDIGIVADAGEALYQNEVNTVVFSPDGSRILTACRDGTARLYEAAKGQAIGAPLQHGGVVRDVAISSDGTRITTRGLDGSVRLWDAGTLKPVGKPFHHSLGNKRGRLTVFSPDSMRLITGGADGAVRIWDANTGKSLGKAFQWGQPVRAVAFCPE